MGRPGTGARGPDPADPGRIQLEEAGGEVPSSGTTDLRRGERGREIG